MTTSSKTSQQRCVLSASRTQTQSHTKHAQRSEKPVPVTLPTRHQQTFNQQRWKLQAGRMEEQKRADGNPEQQEQTAAMLWSYPSRGPHLEAEAPGGPRDRMLGSIPGSSQEDEERSRHKYITKNKTRVALTLNTPLTQQPRSYKSQPSNSLPSPHSCKYEVCKGRVCWTAD